MLKQFQPELGLCLQDLELEEQENRRGGEALVIKNHSSKLVGGARKESRTETLEETEVEKEIQDGKLAKPDSFI